MSTLTQFTGGGIKSVQRGSITITGTTVGSATIASVDINKSMVNFLGFTDSSGSTDNRGVAYIVLSSPTAVVATRATISGSTTVSYEVIEFN